MNEFAPAARAKSPTHGTRIAWLDTARAVGMVLIVVGHAAGLPEAAYAFISAFDLPLFFAFAGFLLPRGKSWRETTLRQARSLLVPYVLIGLVTWAYWCATMLLAPRYGQEALGPIDGLVGLAYGVGDLIPFNAALWFLLALFWASIAASALLRVLPSGAALLLALGPSVWLTTLSIPFDDRLPWSLEPAGVALAFVLLGRAWADHGFDAWIDRPSRGVALLLLGGLGVGVVSQLNGTVSLDNMQFGHPALYWIGNLLGFAAIRGLAALLPQTRLANAIALNSRTIYLFHQPLFSVFTGVLTIGLKLPRSAKETPQAAVLYALAAVVLLLGVGMLLRRWLPWLIGETRPRRAAPSEVRVEVKVPSTL